MEISGKRLVHFYQQASSLIGNRPNHGANMYKEYKEVYRPVPACK